MIKSEFTLINKNTLISNKNFKELKERIETLEAKVDLLLAFINNKEREREREKEGEETIDDIINQAIWNNVMYC